MKGAVRRFECPACGFAISVRRTFAGAARALLRRHAAGHHRKRVRGRW